MALFYGNENFSFAVVEILRELGHDVTTVLESGLANRAVPVTYNRKHFLQLHSDFPKHAGIIVCTYDPDPFGQAEKIHLAVAGLELPGRVVRIYRAGFRLG